MSLLRNILTDNEIDKFPILGKGAAGFVIFHPEYPSYVFKISYDKNVCREWKKELNAYNLMKENELKNNVKINIKYVKLLTLYDYYVSPSNRCIFQFNRVYLPNEKHTIRPYFGEQSIEKIFVGRGKFLGKQQLIKYLGENINVYVYELGMFLAKLHFIYKNDGFDIELFLGKNKYTNEYIIYVGDFDLTNMIENYSLNTIRRIVDGMDAEPQYPSKSDPCYIYFEKGYIDVANKVNKINIANKILEMYD